MSHDIADAAKQAAKRLQIRADAIYFHEASNRFAFITRRFAHATTATVETYTAQTNATFGNCSWGPGGTRTNRITKACGWVRVV